ncbi:MAG TPA: VOC family protein [Puia sp.]|nr:VOC family protein [Puia sp.]
MATLNPYLTFKGNCKEAMEFYKGIFGGELSLMTAGESPVANQMPAAYHNSILHSSLKTENFEIMATDMVPGEFIEGNTVHMSLACKTEKEMRSLFDKLSEAGKVNHPINQMFFGLIGDLTDKFGKHWILEFDTPQKSS